jgi:tetratricopeptide (TPR) repeat protein
MSTTRARFLILVAGTLIVGACSVYEPFNSVEYTREESARRVGDELASEVKIPYELNEEILEYVTGRVSPTGSDKKRVDQILDLIFSGVGLEYHVQPTRDAVETFYSKQANCLSFTHLFVGIGRSQRMNPFYVEVEDFQRWSYQDGTVVSRGHIVAGMFIDGGMSTYDFLPYRAKAYRDFNDIDDLTAMSHHYNNLAAEALMDGDLVEAERNLVIASRLAPDFDKAINNLGVLYMRRNLLDEAIELYEAALVDHPTFVPILSNLSRAYRRSGNAEDADRIAAQLENLDHSNPFFYMSRGLEALEAGDHARALEQLRRALRIDTEVPEIHLGLAKVYMAVGDLKRSRHHVERAIKLDATHPEARRFARMFAEEGPPEIVLDGESR